MYRTSLRVPAFEKPSEFSCSGLCIAPGVQHAVAAPTGARARARARLPIFPGNLGAERLSPEQEDFRRLLPRGTGLGGKEGCAGGLAARGNQRRVRNHRVWNGDRQAGRQVQKVAANTRI